MKFRLNLDTERLQEKPRIFDGRLRNRLCNAASIAEITPEELGAAVEQGRSFTPAVLTGTTADTWQSQQVICADIDNDTGEKDEQGRHIMLANPLTPAGALRCMSSHKITPQLMYYSFSNKEEWPKFRIVLVLDEPITDRRTAADLSARFTAIFNEAAPHCADTTNKDAARLYYGGKPGCIFFKGTTTPINVLQGLPAEQAQAEPQQAAEWRPEPKATRKGANMAELEAQFEADKMNFNLAEYIERTTSSRPIQRGRTLYFNPCPICGHNDDFQVTGALFHCFGASVDKGGTIIDYIMLRDKLELGAAIDKVKFEVLGYDREAWRAAWRADAEADFWKPAENDRAERPQSDFNGGGNINTTLQEETPQNAPQSATESAEPKPYNTSLYIDSLMGAEIERFKRDKKTGFANLDEKAGGLYSGLYVLAAISSLGKTSFALQLADQLAERGEDVIFFSMEQSRLELVSKSLARRMAQKDMANAVTSLQIRKGKGRQQVLKAAEEYKAAMADRMSIYEGDFQCTMATIRNYVQKYIQKNNVRPVIIIDYLQILKPSDMKQSTKDAIDSAVTELKLMSRTLDLTIIVISSVNRANYLTPIDFEALKESGGIEFTADVVWGLQLQCLNDPIFDKQNNIKERREKVKEAKAADPRMIELCCLKNRYGIANYSCYFNYYPAHDLFTEDTGAAVDFRRDDKWANIEIK